MLHAVVGFSGSKRRVRFTFRKARALRRFAMWRDAMLVDHWHYVAAFDTVVLFRLTLRGWRPVAHHVHYGPATEVTTAPLHADIALAVCVVGTLILAALCAVFQPHGDLAAGGITEIVKTLN
jgi:hypothetical protein